MELISRPAASLLPPYFAARHFVRSPIAPVYLLVDQWDKDMVIGASHIAKFKNLVLWPVFSPNNPSALGVCIKAAADCIISCGGHCMQIDDSVRKTSWWDNSPLVAVVRGPYGTLIINKVLCKDWPELAEKVEVI